MKITQFSRKIMIFKMLCLYFILCASLLCQHTWLRTMCVTRCPRRWEKEHQIPWNWNYKELWTTMWDLGIEPGSSVKTINDLNCWAVSPIPRMIFLKTSVLIIMAIVKKISSPCSISYLEENVWNNSVLQNNLERDTVNRQILKQKQDRYTFTNHENKTDKISKL